MKRKVAVLCGIAAAGVLSVSAGIERREFKGGSADIPAEWKGRSVRLEQRIAFCELDATVNGNPDVGQDGTVGMKVKAEGNAKFFKVVMPEQQ